jgi:alanine racemase
VLHDPAGRARIADAAARRGRTPLRVHVEVDTGMRRMGVPFAEAESFVAEVARDPALELAGVMTHLARADEDDLAPTRDQLRAFAELVAALARRGVSPGCVHAANSAGLVAQSALAADGPEQDAVRPGLLLYGAQPAVARRAELLPVMSLRAPVVALRRIRRGEAVGYGALFRARADTQIATLALGYADGVPIAASGARQRVARGRAAPDRGARVDGLRGRRRRRCGRLRRRRGHVVRQRGRRRSRGIAGRRGRAQRRHARLRAVRARRRPRAPELHRQRDRLLAPDDAQRAAGERRTLRMV